MKFLIRASFFACRCRIIGERLELQTGMSFFKPIALRYRIVCNLQYCNQLQPIRILCNDCVFPRDWIVLYHNSHVHFKCQQRHLRLLDAIRHEV